MQSFYHQPYHVHPGPTGEAEAQDAGVQRHPLVDADILAPDRSEATSIPQLPFKIPRAYQRIETIRPEIEVDWGV